MDLNTYQDNALRTAGHVDDEETAAFIAIALAGEAGELANYVKKGLFHGHELNSLVMAAELGDMLWYIAVGAKLLGWSLEDIASYNLEKLRLRYPDGFSSDKSINRNE